jgi:uncharacterized protein (TIGR03067 family)
MTSGSYLERDIAPRREVPMRHAVVGFSLLFCSVALAGPNDGAAKKDLDKFQGKWKVEVEIIEGEKTPANLLPREPMIFKGNLWTPEPKEDLPPIKFKLDPSKKPAAIDLGEGKGAALGVYRLEGDKLTICWEDFGTDSPRPKAVEPTKSNRYLVLRREKKGK